MDELTQDPSQQSDSQATGGEMSDDDIAATLGYITTHSESLLSQDQNETDAQGEADTAGIDSQQGSEVNASGAQAMTKDEEQDKEIQDIRTQLQELLAQETTNGTETENTEAA